MAATAAAKWASCSAPKATSRRCLHRLPGNGRVNHKKVERLWREEGLQFPERHKKRKRLYHHDASVIRLRPKYPNHVWSVDLVHDRLSNGRPYKMLTVLDAFTREALCVQVATKMGAHEVVEAPTPLIVQRGAPDHLRSDTGPEFIAEPLQTWLRRPSRQIALQSPAGQ